MRNTDFEQRGLSIRAFAVLTLLGACAVSPATPGSEITTPVAEIAPSPEVAEKLEEMRANADAVDMSTKPQKSIDAWTALRDYAAQYYQSGHPQLTTYELETAGGYFFLGRHDKAIAIAEGAVEALRRGGAQYRANLADAYNALIVFYQYQGRHREAYPVAQQLLDLRKEEYGDTPSSELAAAYSNLANLESELGNTAEAVRLIEISVSLADRLERIPPNAAVYYGNRVVFLLRSGRIAEALNAARIAAERHREILPPGHPYQSQNLSNLALLLLQTDRPREAEMIARRAVDIAEKGFGRENHQTLTYLRILGETLQAQGKYEPAEALFSASAAGLEKALGPTADRTLLARERLSLLTGDLQALRNINDLRKAEFTDLHRDRIDGATRLAEREYMAGNPEAATLLIRDVITREERLLDAADPRRLQAKIMAAAIAASSGETASAKRITAMMDQVSTEQATYASAGTMNVFLAQTRADSAMWYLESAYQRDDLETAFIAAQNVLAGVTGQAVQKAALRQSVAGTPAEDLLRRQQDLVLRRQRLFFEYAGAVRSAAAREEETDSPRLKDLIVQRQQAEQDFARINGQLKRALGDDAFAPARPIALSEAQDALSSEEALLVSVQTDLRSVLFVITADGAAMHEMDIAGKELEKTVRDLRASLNPARAGLSFDHEASARLYNEIFTDETRTRLADKSSLLLVANGSLSALPFSVLAPAAPSQEMPDWLINRYALTTLPALQSLQKRGMRSPPKIDNLVAIGAPATSADVTDRPSITMLRSPLDRQSVENLPALPVAAKELQDLARLLGPETQVVLTGAAATEDAFYALNLQDVDMLTFATHGLVSGELEGLAQPALVLTPTERHDGILSLSEITTLRLNADWVVLSACNTAASETPTGDGLTGLATAFLYAGGKRLLASHWAVRDDAAAFLTVNTLTASSDDNRSPAENLRKAALKLMQNTSIPNARHPAIWAPFVYVGR